MAKEFVTTMDAKIIQDKHNALLGITKITFKDVMERYVEEVQARKTSTETKRTQKVILSFWLERFGEKRVTTITSRDISQALDELMEKRTSGTVHKYAAILHHVLNKAVLWDYLTKHPMLGMVKPEASKARERYLRKDELERLLRFARADSNPHIYTMIMFAVCTGCRFGELQRVETGDIRNESVTFRLRKNKQIHTVPLAPALQEALMLYNGTVWPMNTETFSDGRISRLLFQNEHGKPVNIRRTWARVLKKAWLDHDGVCWHTLRHSTASFLLEQGHPLAVVAKVLGHRSISSSSMYAHLEQQHIDKILQRFSHEIFGEINL